MKTNDSNLSLKNLKAPKDPVKKRPGFYIMRNKEIMGSIQPDGRGIQFLYQDDGRMLSSARIVGNIKEDSILDLLKSVDGFRKLVHSIGVSVEMEGKQDTVDFVFQMYGRRDPHNTGTVIRRCIPADGMEVVILLSDEQWSEDDNVPGQIRFEFPEAGCLASVSVKFYLQDGYEAPEETEELSVDFSLPDYSRMLERSLLQMGNPARLQAALDKARRGEEITIAFIGGSITQGAGAIPIHTKCYAYETFLGLCQFLGKGTDENIRYRKAGVGGTPSELGMLRYDRDVLRMSDDGRTAENLPDIVIVEFAVNDEGDETKGECYDSLVRKILLEKNDPAVILLFAVFADDWNLQDRLSPVGRAYGLPMVSIKDAAVEQFYRRPGEGRVVSKSQFFYDSYHPSSIGHRIMADCLLHLIKMADAQHRQADDLRIEEIQPPIGKAFERVRLLDRNIFGVMEEGRTGCTDEFRPQIRIDCGDFADIDEELQAVEMDDILLPKKEFPYNWMYRGGKSRGESVNPFIMDIICTSLLIIFKDSANIHTGCAEVWADGEKVLLADPHINGWTHCNAAICFRDKEREVHHVEVRMAEGQEDKDFTILGFGYVE